MPVNLQLLLAFLAFSAVVSAVPGPSVLLETTRAITRGRRSALWIVLGNFVGGMALLGVVLAGLGAIVAASAKLFLALKVAGACYLAWLGIQSILASRRDPSHELDLVEDDAPAGPLTSVRQGFLVGVSNPKSIVVMMAVLPQFVDRALPAPVLQMALIGVAGGVTQVVIEAGWIVAAGSLRTWFRRRPRRLQHLKATGGVAMLALSGKLVAQR